MRKQLEGKYQKLFEKYPLEEPIEAKKLYAIIRSSLQSVMKESKKPAIYCNGVHTKMLMADFMNELKKVKYIVDNYAERENEGGFHFLKDEELEEKGIDAVIISSFKFRNEIVEGLKKNHPNIKYLDIYDELLKNEIVLQGGYYLCNHPYQNYNTINFIQRKISNLFDRNELKREYINLITKYIHIKDFRTAIIWTEKLCKIVNSEEYNQLLKDLEDIYALEKAVALEVTEKNVLMLCIDGLRREDLTKQFMPKLTEELSNNAYIFDNAYSFSTSTYEGLIPVYSENGDLRTKYYEQNLIEEDKCRFIDKAKKQGRNIYFYTDTDDYINSEYIKRSGIFQTATEKIWSFLLDAFEEENGLFYIHILYESHFSFVNPYTKAQLLSEGTALLFDFLPLNGTKLRADYEQQHIDSLLYLDDILTPILSRLKCRMVIYADHGNLILKKECQLQEIHETKLTCAEEWIRIPLIIKSPEMKTNRDHCLISLMSLNDIVDNLLEQKRFEVPKQEFIKVARSELYNPNFRYLYKKMGREQCLQAFEAFVFEEGYKLVIYANEEMKIYKVDNDEKVENRELEKNFLERVRYYITVCNV